MTGPVLVYFYPDTATYESGAINETHAHRHPRRHCLLFSRVRTAPPRHPSLSRKVGSMFQYHHHYNCHFLMRRRRDNGRLYKKAAEFPEMYLLQKIGDKILNCDR